MSDPHTKIIAEHRARFAAMVPEQMPRLFNRLFEAPFYSSMHAAWLELLGLPEYLVARGTVIDVGCGPGGLAALLADTGLQVTGIDRSETMLAAARTRSGSSGLSLRFMQGDATALPLDDGSVGVAMCSSLLNVLEQPVLALREMGRVTGPRGVVSALLPTPALTESAARAYAARHSLDPEDAALLELWAGPAPKTAQPKIRAWFAEAGLSPVRTDALLDGMVCVATWRGDVRST